MTITLYDVAIVGAGPGGIACAIKASEKGLTYLVLENG
jgi:thioredoxin reductase (NADPH)